MSRINTYMNFSWYDIEHYWTTSEDISFPSSPPPLTSLLHLRFYHKKSGKFFTPSCPVRPGPAGLALRLTPTSFCSSSKLGAGDTRYKTPDIHKIEFNLTRRGETIVLVFAEILHTKAYSRFRAQIPKFKLHISSFVLCPSKKPQREFLCLTDEAVTDIRP